MAADWPALAEFSAALDGPVSKDDSRAVLEQLQILLREAWVHLPPAGGRFDPVEQLQRLSRRAFRSQARFQDALLAVFATIGDPHTSCHLPQPRADQVAYLPFVAAPYVDHGRPGVAVIASACASLEVGETLIRWNGKPIDKIIADHMDVQMATNPVARRAKAWQRLTMRSLAQLPLPIEDTVYLDVSNRLGRQRRLAFDWKVAKATDLSAVLGPLLGTPGEALQARTIHTACGDFGVIRLASLRYAPAVLLTWLKNALATLANSKGLILDLRGCEDGYIATAEHLLGALTSAPLEPLAFQFRRTDLIDRVVSEHPGLTHTLAPHKPYEAGFTPWHYISDPEAVNAVACLYRGPVLVLVDGLTFSSAEIFAAGFQDHKIGPVLGSAACTGGGGASPWSQHNLSDLAGDATLAALTNGPKTRLAVRRGQRAGVNDGMLLQKHGVRPDYLHYPTRADLLQDDRDLWEYAGTILHALCPNEVSAMARNFFDRPRRSLSTN